MTTNLRGNGAAAGDNISPPLDEPAGWWGIGVELGRGAACSWPLKVSVPLATGGLVSDTEVSSCGGGRVPRVAGE